MKRIVLTGGGTAGHVTPNIALLPKLRELGYDIHMLITSYSASSWESVHSLAFPKRLRLHPAWEPQLSSLLRSRPLLQD